MRIGAALHTSRLGPRMPAGNVAGRVDGRRRMGLLDGKRILVTGVLTDASLAFGVARLAQEEGAEVVLTGAGRGLSLTERTARKLPPTPPVLELDVTDARAPRRGPRRRWPSGGTGSTACSTPSASPRRSCLGGDFIDAPWDDVAVALQVSAYSLKALADAFVPLMTDGGSIVGLDFDATVAWPAYDWMGVAKAALESTSPLPRPRPRAAGHPGEPRGRRARSRRWRPSRSPASRRSRTSGHDRAPLGWDVNDSDRRGPGLRGAAVGLVPGHHRRDRPRRRRLPRHRRLSACRRASATTLIRAAHHASSGIPGA